MTLRALTATLVTLTLMVAGCSELPFLSAKVPDVTDFSAVEARQILEGEGFEVSADTCGGQSVVRNQVPAPGERAEKGGTVSLAVECDDVSDWLTAP